MFKRGTESHITLREEKSRNAQFHFLERIFLVMSPYFLPPSPALLGEKERWGFNVNALSRQESELLIYNKTT